MHKSLSLSTLLHCSTINQVYCCFLHQSTLTPDRHFPPPRAFRGVPVGENGLWRLGPKGQIRKMVLGSSYVRYFIPEPRYLLYGLEIGYLGIPRMCLCDDSFLLFFGYGKIQELFPKILGGVAATSTKRKIRFRT